LIAVCQSVVSPSRPSIVSLLPLRRRYYRLIVGAVGHCHLWSERRRLGRASFTVRATTPRTKTKPAVSTPRYPVLRRRYTKFFSGGLDAIPRQSKSVQRQFRTCPTQARRSSVGQSVVHGLSTLGRSVAHGLSPVGRSVTSQSVCLPVSRSVTRRSVCHPSVCRTTRRSVTHPSVCRPWLVVGWCSSFSTIFCPRDITPEDA
jgi:hypothetical protein